MHYDSLTSGDESSPTTEDLHGDAAVPVGGCHEAPGEEMSRHFGWGEAPTDEQMEADYAARRCEAELARRCVATGRAQQAAAPVYSRDVVPDGAKWRASVVRDGVKVPVPGRFNTFDGADAMAAVRVRSMQEEDRGGRAA